MTLFVILAVVLVAAGGSYYMFFMRNKGGKVSATPMPEAVPGDTTSSFEEKDTAMSSETEAPVEDTPEDEKPMQ